MKKLLCIILALIFSAFNSAIAEDFPINWLWDIPLFQNIETVISQLNSATGVSLEQDDRFSFRYRPVSGSPMLNINQIPFDVEMSAFSYDDDLAIGLGIPEGEIYGISLRIEHNEKVGNNPELSPEELERKAKDHTAVIYKMLESKCGTPIASYLHIQNSELLGTSTIFDQEVGKWKYFLCPYPYDVDLKRYKETGASVISFNYCWGNISMSATYVPNSSLQIEIEEKCWKTITYDAFKEITSENTLDYFDFVEKQAIGVTSF